jgi:hypothetical protein
MQHSHVKRKESLMNRYSIEEYNRRPELRARLYWTARRERSRALFAAAAWLWQHGKALLSPRDRGHVGDWLARIG